MEVRTLAETMAEADLRRMKDRPGHQAQPRLFVP